MQCSAAGPHKTDGRLSAAEWSRPVSPCCSPACTRSPEATLAAHRQRSFRQGEDEAAASAIREHTPAGAPLLASNALAPQAAGVKAR